jgi:hypothetical protein
VPPKGNLGCDTGQPLSCCQRSVTGQPLDTGFGLFGDSTLPRVYNVTVDANGPYGPVETLTYVIDLNVLRNAVLDRESIEWSAKRLADELKKSTDVQKKQLRELVSLVRHVDVIASSSSLGSDDDSTVIGE